jgi:hypothetical protein
VRFYQSSSNGEYGMLPGHMLRASNGNSEEQIKIDSVLQEIVKTVQFTCAETMVFNLKAADQSRHLFRLLTYYLKTFGMTAEGAVGFLVGPERPDDLTAEKVALAYAAVFERAVLCILALNEQVSAREGTGEMILHRLMHRFPRWSKVKVFPVAS